MSRTTAIVPLAATLVAAAVLGTLKVPTARADTVTDWNRVMITGFEQAKTPAPAANRLAAIVQTSVFDALNGVERRYTPYHVDAAAPRGASRRAAVAGAAYAALVGVLPSQKPLFDQQLAATLAQISDPADPGQSVDRGLEWGTSVANQILVWRAGDGIATGLPPYVAGTAPGDWQPTPPLFGPPLFRQFATMTPFALTSPSQFRPAGPPALGSARYTQDLQEIEMVGGATSLVRTAEEAQTAAFWQADVPAAMWNRVADQLADEKATTLTQNARVLALMNIALADATIGSWNAKNFYDTWRPVTAIRALLDPTWTPLLATPPFQEYPSAHTAVSDAGSSVLADFYGDATPFTVTSSGLPGVERSFGSFSAAVRQIENARVWAGFHFRFSSVDGSTLGASIGRYVVDHVAQPVNGAASGQLGR